MHPHTNLLSYFGFNILSFQSLGLLINLVELCDLNRVKMLEMKTQPAYENVKQGETMDAILSLVEVKCGNTVKFLNFGTPEIFAVIYLTFKQEGQT